MDDRYPGHEFIDDMDEEIADDQVFVDSEEFPDEYDSNYVQHDSDQVPKEAPPEPPSGYEPVQGNCPGSTIPPTSSKPLKDCAKQCDDEVRCAGFAHSGRSNVCIMKSTTCENPVQNTEYRYYRKSNQLSLFFNIF